ncbi:hypothetical protein NFI96_006951 [Prochilodus magdalenae]|nr:hypothetical protein NFI96_006951 [Prochilodus magdalenae]
MDGSPPPSRLSYAGLNPVVNPGGQVKRNLLVYLGERRHRLNLPTLPTKSRQIMSGSGSAGSHQEQKRGRAAAKDKPGGGSGSKNGGAASAEQANLAQDVTDKISALLDAKFDHFQSALDSITARLENNTTRITEAEGRLSETEDKVLNLENKVALLETAVKTLVERAEDLENRSRRDNIRIMGLKEGAEGGQPLRFFQTWLPTLLGLETKHGVVKIVRAHRTLGPPRNDRSRPVLIKLHNYGDKLKILQAARKKGQLLYEGQSTRSFCQACGVNVCGGGKRDTDDLLSCPHYSLQGLAIRCGAVPKPGSDAAAQDALDGSSVEGGEDGSSFYSDLSSEKSGSKNSKHETRAQTLATRAATSAAGKLASFANTSVTSLQAASMLEEPASAPLATADQLSTEFAKQRSSLKEDLFSLIQEAVKPQQVSTEPLQATVNAFQTRLTSVESVAGDNFERLTAAESTVELLRVQNQSLLDRLEDLENRSPRCNLRIWNIPEGSERGKDPLKFMAELLMQMLGPDVFPAPP